MPRLFPLLALSLTAAAAAMAADPQTVNISTLRAQMRFSINEIHAAPGVPLKIDFENTDDMPHNLVFCKPGTDVVALSNKQLEKPEEAIKRNFLPDDPAIWLHSKVLQPKEKDELSFNAPEQPGVYPFVCTMPGHAASMQGKLLVEALGKGITNLNFKLYLGEWQKLPDFSKLEVHRSGPIEDNLIQLKFDDYKNNYGVVFDGKLNALVAGDYTFSLASDDGAQLSVDGKVVIDNDGIHPATTICNGRVHLATGTHDLHVEYFQGGGEAMIFAAWKGPNFSITPLSKWLPDGWDGGAATKKDEHTGMPLVVDKEPVIYRNFISGAGNRAIGVGYPGNINIAWSAEGMNLALIWRGAFIDAARHWTDRGGGHQPPLGYDVLRPVSGDTYPPFAILSSPDHDWPKDRQMSRVSGYQWKGYHLDEKRFPTFFYEWNGLKVSDRYDVEGNGIMNDGKLIRTLKLEGPIPQNAYLRVTSGEIKANGSTYTVNAGKFNLEGRDFENHFLVSVDGAAVAGQNLVAPARPEIKITYTWPAEQMAHDHSSQH